MEDLPSGGVGQHVVARLDSDSKATAGGEIELVLDTTQIKLFDPDGGRSLTYSGTPGGNGAGGQSGRRPPPGLPRPHEYTGNALQASRPGVSPCSGQGSSRPQSKLGSA